MIDLEEEAYDYNSIFEEGYECGAYETRLLLADRINAQSIWDRDHLLTLIWSTSVDDDTD